MSTPSGKPFDPFDISAYAPKKARQRSTEDRQEDEQFSTQQPSGSEDMAPTSPFSAKREWPHLSTRDEHSEDLDRREAPMSGAERASEFSPLESGDVGEGSEYRSAEDGLNSAEAAGTDPGGDADRDDPFGFSELARDSAPEPMPGNDDIERLESSLRWLRREDAAGRLPRATQLPPVQGLRPTRGLPRKGETYINGFRLPRSLEPEFVPPPPIRAHRDHLRGPMRIVIAALIAGPVAYYFTTSGMMPDSLTQRAEKFASLDTHVPGYAPASASAVPQRDVAEGLTARGETIGMLPPVASQDTNPVAAETVAAADRGSGKDVVSVAKAAVPPRPEIAPAPPPVAPVVREAARDPSAAGPTAVPSQPVHRLDPADIKLLVQQGEQFVAAGDLVTARVVFQRAAEAGDAMGALAMGATYDPIVLAKLGVRGIEADVEKARTWYKKAQDFGSAEAPRRLELLANR